MILTFFIFVGWGWWGGSLLIRGGNTISSWKMCGAEKNTQVVNNCRQSVLIRAAKWWSIMTEPERPGTELQSQQRVLREPRPPHHPCSLHRHPPYPFCIILFPFWLLSACSYISLPLPSSSFLSIFLSRYRPSVTPPTPTPPHLLHSFSLPQSNSSSFIGIIRGILQEHLSFSYRSSPPNAAALNFSVQAVLVLLGPQQVHRAQWGQICESL